MLESFVIMLREGVEAALVVGIVLVVLKRSQRRDLERPVYWGLALAVLASIGAAVALSWLPNYNELYDGVLYWVSAVFVATMMWWMHSHGKSLKSEIESRVHRAVEAEATRHWQEAWLLGGFAFLMIFREGAESVMFLSAVNLTTAGMLSGVGAALGLLAAVVFCVMFVRGSLPVNLGRFFRVTEWVLAIFIAQLVINGYHELSEAGYMPANRQSMALVGPVVRHNSLFILAILAIPMFIWLTRQRPEAGAVGAADELPAAERRLAQARARRERFYRRAAVVTTLVILCSIGVVYAQEQMPRQIDPPTMVMPQDSWLSVPLADIGDGRLHRYGAGVGDRVVRFLVMKTPDGKVHTTLDACQICGPQGYIEGGPGLLTCLNCSAEINILTLGNAGGCNPIPLASQVTATDVRIALAAVQQAASIFPAEAGPMAVDPVCGMKINIAAAAASEKRGERTYYFCSDRCHKQFNADPDHFTK